MKTYDRHKIINRNSYNPADPEPIARYGLPATVEFCVRCGISNQRPNAAESECALVVDSAKPSIKLDEKKVCDACRFWETKNKAIDWETREQDLRDLCDRYRRSDGRYDCLVPGSGGKDSFMQSHLLKYKYGMHPLTVTWAPQMYTTWGHENLQNWIDYGFDNILITPNGRVRRLLTRLALETLFHPFQPFVIGQKNIAARMSIEYDVPLVFYGDHAAEWGVPLAESEDAQMNYNYFIDHGEANLFLSGVSFADLKEYYGLTDNDLKLYMPLSLNDIRKVGTEIHYMGYYEKWDPQTNYYFAMENSDFQPSPERNPGTYTKFASLDDKVDDFNFYCYFIKFGIGRATIDASQDVRAAHIGLDEAKALIRRFDGEFPERFAEDFFTYVSLPEKKFEQASTMFEQPIMDRSYFEHLCDRFRSPHLWAFENGAWTLRHVVWNED